MGGPKAEISLFFRWEECRQTHAASTFCNSVCPVFAGWGLGQENCGLRQEFYQLKAWGAELSVGPVRETAPPWLPRTNPIANPLSNDISASP